MTTRGRSFAASRGPAAGAPVVASPEQPEITMNGVDRTLPAAALPRSYLYVPGDQERLLAKALDRGADALIIDLEDAVHPDRKDDARAGVTEWLAGLAGTGTPIWLRVNATTTAADLRVLTARVAGVMLPAADPDTVDDLQPLLDEAEERLRLDHGRLGVIALIETARGLLDVRELARRNPRVRHLAIGRADLSGELGLTLDPDGPEFRTLMLPLVLASAAAGIPAPIAPTATDFRDLDGLRSTTAALAAMGFAGRTAIHPAQLPVINEVFTPTPDAVRRAERTLELFHEALSRGSGVTVDDEGRMIDAAVVRRAQAVLARAGR